jgi:hypothetical protein
MVLGTSFVEKYFQKVDGQTDRQKDVKVEI